MDCASPLTTRQDSTYKSGKVVQTNGATSYGRKFLAAYPRVGKRDNPTPASVHQLSVYYWWWAYLKRNAAYIACCERGGTGRLAALYKDFGDVRSEDFRAWWTTENRGGYLFAEAPAINGFKELASREEWREEWTKDSTLVIAMPLTWSKRALQKSFNALLKKRHKRGRGKKAFKGRETSTALYPLAHNFNVHSLKVGLAVYDAIEAANKAGTGATYYQIGVALRLVPTALPTAAEIAANERDADKVNVMNVAMSRYYKRTAAMVANAGKGVFPVS
jgi:hypothetical protein